MVSATVGIFKGYSDLLGCIFTELELSGVELMYRVIFNLPVAFLGCILMMTLNDFFSLSLAKSKKSLDQVENNDICRCVLL